MARFWLLAGSKINKDCRRALQEGFAGRHVLISIFLGNSYCIYFEFPFFNMLCAQLAPCHLGDKSSTVTLIKYHLLHIHVLLGQYGKVLD